MEHIQTLYLLTEVGKILRRSPSSMRRLLRSGELSYLKIGRAVRIRQVDLERFIRNQTVASK